MPDVTAIARDVSYALRAFARDTTTIAVVVCSLALGVGANAALYSVVDALLVRPPTGVADAGRLASLFTAQHNGASRGFSSYDDYLSLRSSGLPFASLTAFDDSAIDVASIGTARHRVRIVATTPEYFATLGQEAFAGRLLRDDDGGGEAPGAVISHAIWMASGSPANIIGTPITVGGRPFTVVGIAAPRFSGLQIDRVSDVWIVHRGESKGRGDRRFSMVGRIAPGASMRDADARVRAVSEQLARQYPETNRGTRSDGDAPRWMSVERFSRIDPAERQQLVLITFAVLGATILLLVSACVNAAAMLISRSAARRRELAVKLALGASRQLLARQALVDGLVVALTGGVLGLLLAYWTSQLLPSFFAPEEAAQLDARLSAGSAAVTLALSALAGVAFAIGPARHAAQTLDVEVLRGDAAGVSDRAGSARLRSLVVIAQVALSTAMLIGAGLLVRALNTALEGDLGPTGRGIGMVFMRLPGTLLNDVVQGTTFVSAAGETIKKLPGVDAVSWVATMPLGSAASQVFEVEVGPGLIETVDVDINVATGDYFRTMKIPIVEGRSFAPSDGALAKPVVVVNEVFARRYIGTRAAGVFISDAEGVRYEIVGVVGSGKYRTFQSSPEPMVYFPYSQRVQPYLHLVVRFRDDAAPRLAEVVSRLTSIDGDVSLGTPRTFDDHLAEALTLDRLTTTTVAGCGLAALALATIGVYGVIADGVRRRTPEIGLRIALGAGAPQVVRLVFGEGLHLAAMGAAAGVVVALLLTRAAAAFVHGIPGVETTSLVVVPLALVLVVLGAAALPTRRALKISPTIALRSE